MHCQTPILTPEELSLKGFSSSYPWPCSDQRTSVLADSGPGPLEQTTDHFPSTERQTISSMLNWSGA